MLTFINLLKLLWNNRDQLVQLLEVLPPLLNTAGQSMKVAGGGAEAAGRFVKGGGGTSLNARQLVLDTAAALANSRTQINDAASQIETAATRIGNVKVPTVTPEFTTLTFMPSLIPGTPPVEVEVLKDLDFGESSLFGSVKNSLNAGADRLRDVGDELQTSVNRLNQFATALDNTGQGLETLGIHLRQGGEALQQLGN